MVKANDDGSCLRLAHAQVENEIPARPRRARWRGAREYRRLRAFSARSPYGESTFKRNRPSFAVLMVLGGGGGQRERQGEGGERKRECVRVRDTQRKKRNKKREDWVWEKNNRISEEHACIYLS